MGQRCRFAEQSIQLTPSDSRSSTHPVLRPGEAFDRRGRIEGDRKSTRLNSSHLVISYAVFCLKKKTRTRPDRHSRRVTIHVLFFFNDTATTEIYTLSYTTLFRSV